MAARNKPAGIRSLVYGIGKSKGGIEGLSVSATPQIGIVAPLNLSLRTYEDTHGPNPYI
jgi:hypothetical protein